MTDRLLPELFPQRCLTTVEYPERAAQTSESPAKLQPTILKALGGRALYDHQAEAIEASLRGDDVIVTTGTGSGKSLCAHLPLLQRLLEEPSARALVVFPTKALAQDQTSKLTELLHPFGLRVATYDGDTPASQRSAIRKAAHVVVTNPDMLHIGVLPQHELWATFLKRLRSVVIDEMHVYRGLFGAHASGVFHRLLRLAEWSGSRPQVTGLSATLGDPAETLHALTGRTGVVVSRDASPRGAQLHSFVGPAQEGQNSPGSNVEASLLTAALVAQGDRVVTFCRSRIGVELVLRDLKNRVEDPTTVEAYRSGYTAAERRDIERRMHAGQLAAVVSTNALELGVDIGGLDAVVMNGYPGSVTSFWQQAGRAGRAGRVGRVYMVAHPDPAEAAIAADPLNFLGRGYDGAGPAMQNLPACKSQLTCAAYERALGPQEIAQFGPVSNEGAQELLDEGTLVPSAGRYFYPSHTSPAAAVSLRSSTSGQIELREGHRLVGSMEPVRALGYAHPGAVYLHRGETYRVERLDWAQKRAEIVPCPNDSYTLPVMSGVVEPGDLLESAYLGTFQVSLWRLQVTATCNSYKVMSLPSHDVVGVYEVQMPTLTLNTVGVRVELPAPDSLEDLPLVATHTLEHALSSLTPLLTGAQRSETASAWYALAPDTMRPCVWVYDLAEGGAGLAESLFRQAPAWLVAAWKLAKNCSCVDGCPLCVMSGQCEARNELISRSLLAEYLASSLAGSGTSG